jgi:hypothetical protein
MKSVIQERGIERSENFKENTFQIKANGKAFKILSDGLYSDKIKAIIRELSCNAYDAHVDADNLDTPFDVHLPTSFEPTFYIRDYGTGLSMHDMEHVYTTYFESTKTESNDAIGCLGLGSKSPFSYVDMFTVTSFYNGEQYVYSALLNEYGTPSILLISNTKTEEPNGLKIQFAVKREDQNEFRYKAESVFLYFKLLPNLLGNAPTVDPPNYTVQNEEWGLSSDRQGDAKAIMGNVAYPISLNKVDFSQQEKMILQRFPVDLFFNIGDLEVAASREGLSYDERTTQAIRDRVQKIIDHEKNRIEKDLAKQKCYWDAVVWINKEKSNNQIVGMLFNHTTLQFKGKDIKQWFDVDPKEYNVIDPDFSVSKVSSVEKWRRNTGRYEKVVGKPDFNYRIAIREKAAIYFNDCKTRHMVRVKSILQDNDSLDTIYLIKSSDQSLRDKIQKEIGISEIKLLSSIEPPAIIRKKRDNSAVGHFVKLNWKTAEYSDACQFWETIGQDEDFSLDDGGYYIPINRWKTIHNDREYAPRNLLYKVNQLIQVISPTVTPVVYGVKRAKVDLVEGKDGWINWIDYANEIIRDYALTESVFEKLEVLCSQNNVSFDDVGRIFRTIKKVEDATSNDFKVVDSDWMGACNCEVLKQLAKHYDAWETTGVNGNVRYLWGYIQSGLSTVEQSELDKLQLYHKVHEEMMNDFDERYPLLDDCYNIFSRKAGIMKILDYINAMNKYKKFPKKRKKRTTKKNP